MSASLGVPASFSASRSETSFFRWTAISLSAFAGLAFGAFSLAMAFDPLAFPVTTHLHALTMVAWLGLFTSQALLATGGDIALHRRMGWIGASCALLVCVTGAIATSSAVSEGRVPPIFPPSYFFTMAMGDLLAFFILFGAALIFRRQTPFHKRLMLGALLALYEPVFGRVFLLIAVPAFGGPEAAMPILMGNFELLELTRAASHLSLVAVIAMLDRAASGRFHPAWAGVLLAVGCIYAGAAALGLG